MARSGTLDPVDLFRFEVQIISLSMSPGNALNGFRKGADGKLKLTQFGRVGFSSVDVPETTINVMEYRENLDAPVFKKYPGLMRFSDINLQRGVILPEFKEDQEDKKPIDKKTKVPNKDFYRWLTKVNSINPVMLLMGELANFQNTGIQKNSDNYRKDAIIILRGRDGTAAKRWYLVNVWPSAYKGSTDLNANAEEKAIERITLTCEAAFELPSFADAAKEFIANTVDNDLVGEAADLDFDFGL